MGGYSGGGFGGFPQQSQGFGGFPQFGGFRPQQYGYQNKMGYEQPQMMLGSQMPMYQQPMMGSAFPTMNGMQQGMQLPRMMINTLPKDYGVPMYPNPPSSPYQPPTPAPPPMPAPATPAAPVAPQAPQYPPPLPNKPVPGNPNPIDAGAPTGPMQPGQTGWGWNFGNTYSPSFNPAANRYINHMLNASNGREAWRNQVDNNNMIASIGQLSGVQFDPSAW